ncbi:MAG: UDP-N-acetylglucosamine--N-acetylmuramyl-(pentapeptide) pyrophosphoryl-undecaprenol N-acetylglucosamine transferase, partial [Planctomycetes bacterium]|nr:UDP-N-acetylglucosamine--N-acetylmuramyl-(pentapeptide) pyrophosphoryl-undecaprenol N-acetylglucosamine transferase [Planctomycetota bacterium]
NAVIASLGRLGKFKDAWQIVHLTGRGNYYKVKAGYEQVGCEIRYKLLDYFDDMAGLYAAADLVIGRAGAVSIAEFAAAGLGVICLPYPYHKDKHQYLNAGKLVTAGAAIIVDDRPNAPAKTAKDLADNLEEIMADEEKLKKMAAAAKGIAKVDAAEKIAKKII